MLDRLLEREAQKLGERAAPFARSARRRSAWRARRRYAGRYLLQRYGAKVRDNLQPHEPGIALLCLGRLCRRGVQPCGISLREEMRLAPGVDTLPEEKIRRLAFDGNPGLYVLLGGLEIDPRRCARTALIFRDVITHGTGLSAALGAIVREVIVAFLT